MAGYLGNNPLSSNIKFNFQWIEEKNEMLVGYNSKEIAIKHILEDGDFAGVFLTEEYSEIDVNGRLVIDIGASICDTALYFVLRGANKIIAFEPVPEVFYMGLDNIISNNLSETIIYKNEAVGGTSGVINIGDYSNSIAGGSALKLNNDGTEVRQITLTSILDSIEFNNKRAILKLDCEGCEYALFSEVNTNLLQKLEIVVLEYHNGLQYIPDLLSKHGFTTQIIKPKTEKIGLLTAKRDILERKEILEI